MNNKVLALLLALYLIILALPMSVAAAETFSYEVFTTTTTPCIGSEFEVIFSLTNYAELTSEIRGLQIDVANIDTSKLEVVSHDALFDDAAAASNKTSYQVNKNLVRYVYLNLSGSMDKSVTDVMRFRLKVKDTVSEEGSITMPITIKIGTMDKENITLNDSLTINYKNVLSDIVSVDISWGSMEFSYEDGTWDNVKHKWLDKGWKASEPESNLITVKNTGTTEVKTELFYSHSSSCNNLSGVFVDSSNKVIDSQISLAPDSSEQKYWFNISGTTETRWTDNYVIVGTITMTITR